MGKPLIVLISGYKGVGKDTVATELQSLLPSASISSFATPLKRLIELTFDISPSELTLYKNNPQAYQVRLPTRYTDFRIILQRFGTEACHTVFGTDVWVNLFMSSLPTSDVILVPDFRYDSELTILLANNYKCIHVQVTSSTHVSTDSHASEQLPTATCDIIVDNTAKDYSLLAELTQVMAAVDKLT